MATPQGDYWIRLRPLADDGVPAIIRLRRLLKYALRAVGLRCVSVAEVAASAPLVPAVPPADAAGAKR